MSDVIEYPAPDLSLSIRKEDAWERERRAFWELLPSLRAAYEGHFVAIRDGKVVASGPDEVAVALDAYSRLGYGPLYVGQVSSSPPMVVRIPTPRFLRGSDRT